MTIIVIIQLKVLFLMKRAWQPKEYLFKISAAIWQCYLWFFLQCSGAGGDDVGGCVCVCSGRWGFRRRIHITWSLSNLKKLNGLE